MSGSSPAVCRPFPAAPSGGPAIPTLPGGDLTARRLQPEVMDDPGLDPRLHAGALKALARINRLSGTAGRVWREVEATARGGEATGPLRILDVACGGGEVAVTVAARARAAGIPVRVTACDLSPTALAAGRARAERAGVEVEWIRGRVPEDLPEGPFHLAYTTLFLHHLPRSEAVALLRTLSALAPRGVVDDLRRTRAGYLLALAAGHLLTRSPVVRVDGPLSVQAAFTLDEVEEMARDAGLPGVRLRPVWPQRFSLTWGEAS